MNHPIDTVKRLFPAELHGRLYLVGGSVRDLQLNRPINDLDLIAILPPEELSTREFRLVEGKSTAPVWFRHTETAGIMEVTLLENAEVNLLLNLEQRDFTINAMALTLDGEIIDPMHGRNDLERRCLRACRSTAFTADPLRLFRALRFEADGWEMDSDTERLVRRVEWHQALQDIPIERFSREMLKALSLQRPELFFQRMLEFQAGENYLPELFRMRQVPAGPLEHHPEGDLFTHSIQVLQRASAITINPLARFCALFHDLGKLATSPELYPRHHGHDQSGFKLASDFCQRLRLPARYGTALALVSKLHTTFNLWDQLRIGTKLRMAEQAIDAGIVDILPQVAIADKAGNREPDGWKMAVEIAGMSATSLGIDSNTLSQIDTKKRGDFVLQARIKKMKHTTSCG